MERGRVTTYRLGEQGGGGRQCPTQCLFSAGSGLFVVVVKVEVEPAPAAFADVAAAPAIKVVAFVVVSNRSKTSSNC